MGNVMNRLVLLVDDDPVMTVLHKALVKRAGLGEEPLVCVHGAQALEAIRQHDDDLVTFLVLLDINMPIMNGWEFLEAIQSLPAQARIQVCVVTSSIDASDQEQAYSFPQVVGFITKPLTRQALLDLKALHSLQPFFTDSST